MRKAITGLAIVAMVAGVALVAVSLNQAPSALAQEAEDEVFNQPLEGLLDDLVEDDVITEDQRDKIAEACEDRLVRLGRGFHGTYRLDIVADVLGMDVDELAVQLRNGLTIADIAGDQTQDVIDALVAEYTARIDDAVADERISEGKAEEVRAALAEQVEAMVNGKYPSGVVPFGMDRFHGPNGFDFFGPPRGFDGFGFRGGFGLDSIAEALGLETNELREQLADGSSLADIAEEQGVEIQDIVDAALADLDEQLRKLVADERLTQERADVIRDGLAEAVESMVTGKMPGFGGFKFEFKLDGDERFPHFRGHGHRFPSPGDFFGDPDDVEGEGFFHFHGPGGGFPFPEDLFGVPDEVDGTGTSA